MNEQLPLLIEQSSKENRPRTKNDLAWEKLFEKHNILAEIARNGQFIISAAQIKTEREPRLMAKFDHTVNLPLIFKDNNLAILPISRSQYIIADFAAYHPLKTPATAVHKASIPKHIQSLNYSNISSETMALNCALVSGILADFLEDSQLTQTVSGRMGSAQFSFQIENAAKSKHYEIDVNGSQIEIDAAIEGLSCLALIEAKRDLAEDFLIRQLYYPFRVWSNRTTKTVRPIFLVFSNGVFHISEYKFNDPGLYNSIILVKQKSYALEDTDIEMHDLEALTANINLKPEPPGIAFPQADSFERVINLCELLISKDLSHEQITQEYAFSVRQTDYYTVAGIYLGLINKKNVQKTKPVYTLSDYGKKLMQLNYKSRQLEFCTAILRQQPFYQVFELAMLNHNVPEKPVIAGILKGAVLD